MAEYTLCTICGKCGWKHEHRCPPLWQCEIPDWLGDGETQTIYAYDAEEAAEKIVKKSDDGAAFDAAIKVRVRRHDKEEWQTFEVRAESIPRYYATEITEE